jgi:hypothetical protein
MKVHVTSFQKLYIYKVTWERERELQINGLIDHERDWEKDGERKFTFTIHMLKKTIHEIPKWIKFNKDPM